MMIAYFAAAIQLAACLNPFADNCNACFISSLSIVPTHETRGTYVLNSYRQKPGETPRTKMA